MSSKYTPINLIFASSPTVRLLGLGLKCIVSSSKVLSGNLWCLIFSPHKSFAGSDWYVQQCEDEFQILGFLSGYLSVDSQKPISPDAIIWPPSGKVELIFGFNGVGVAVLYTSNILSSEYKVCRSWMFVCSPCWPGTPGIAKSLGGLPGIW